MTDDHTGATAADDAALRAIVEGVEAETGDQFFASLVRHLAEALDVAYAFVSEFTPDRLHFRTRAVWGRGRWLDPIVVPIEGTPCEAVLSGRMSHYPTDLQQRFPRDAGLATWSAESYCGVPLLDAGGEVVGHLAIIDDRPMLDGPRGLSILRIFAARARAEIDRLHAEEAIRLSEQRLARILDSAMDAIVTIDDAHQIALFNDAAEKVFRCPAATALGASFDRFCTDALRAALDESLRAFAAGGQTRPYIWAPEGLAARDADGRTFAVEGTISHVEVAGRRLYTLILRDIEERRRAEEELRRLHRQNEYLQEEINAVHNADAIVGRSPAFLDARDKAALVAGTDSSVLILGETGTGKELIARAVHAQSRRRDRPLIKVNCAALPSGLIESELFGHEKGAFTGAAERRVGRFELAHGGTIFLDEIGEVPLAVQAKLLRVLQEQEFERVGGTRTIRVDVRVIAATNRDLARSVAEKTFREDLYYRLNVFPIALPPLRERRDDVGVLAHFFVGRFAGKIGRRITRIPREAMERLAVYAWPGNVRELENVIERAVILSSGPELEIGPEVLAAGVPGAPRPAASEAVTLEDVERSHIIAVLERTRWRIDGPRGAAKLLDLNPSTLRSRMAKLGIQRARAARPAGVSTSFAQDDE